MRLPRFTTRRLMAMVALVAAVIGGCRTYNLASIAYSHRQWAESSRRQAAEARRRAADPNVPAEQAEQWRFYAEALKRAAQYSDRWAARPWLLERRDWSPPK
jgi:membrane protein YqaA with SNARE-associated domain